MTYRALALSLDADDRVVEAAWAYELAIQAADAGLDLYLNLAALYFAATETGFFAAHHLEQRFVDAAYPRACQVLDLAERRHGRCAEIDFWRLHMRERVLYEEVPAEAYLELAARRESDLPFLAIYVNSNGEQYAAEAARALDAAADSNTVRSRYIESFGRR